MHTTGVSAPCKSLYCASVIWLPSCSVKEPQFLTAFDNIIKITLYTYSDTH